MAINGICSKRWLLLVLCLLGEQVDAFEIGVGTHFGQGRGDPVKTFAWLKSAGMASFRDEIYWNSVEFEPDRFSPDKSASLSLAAYQLAPNRGLNPILILSYGNPLYDQGSQPSSNQGRAAFAHYAGWLAGELKGKVRLFEVWNEWNLGAGANPEQQNSGDAKAYVQLAAASYEAVKKANPEAMVLAGAVGDEAPDWPWLKQALNEGLLNHADGISVHLYNHSLPKNRAGAGELITRLTALQSLLRASRNGQSVPIYVTEIGWPTYWGLHGVPEQIAAEQSARFLLQAFTVDDVAGLWWYEYSDSGNNPLEREHRFGLLTADLQEKKAGCLLRLLTPFIRQAHMVQHLESEGSQALLLKGENGKALLAAWHGKGYEGNSVKLELEGEFAEVNRFQQNCGVRVNPPFIKRSAKAMEIEANTYPALMWVGSNSQLRKITHK